MLVLVLQGWIGVILRKVDPIKEPKVLADRSTW